MTKNKREPIKPKVNKRFVYQVTIYITTSKIMAVLVLIMGSIFSYMYNSPEVIIFTLSLSSGLIGLKSWSEGLTRRKEMEYGDYYYNQKNNSYNASTEQEPNNI